LPLDLECLDWLELEFLGAYALSAGLCPTTAPLGTTPRDPSSGTDVVAHSAVPARVLESDLYCGPGRGVDSSSSE
jgi:hypothetical protein